MRLTIIGKAPAWGDVESPTSSYRLDVGDRSLLVDCGHGAVGALRRLDDPRAVTDVIITHLHADHTADLVALAYFYRYAPGAPSDWSPPTLHLPPGGVDGLARLAEVFDGGTVWEDGFSAVVEYSSERSILPDALVLPFPVEHFVPTWGIRVDEGLASLAFTADTGPHARLAEWTSGAGLLLAEATMPESAAGHLTASEAGDLAREARAGTLLLTHFSDLYPEGQPRARASERCSCPVVEARSGMRWESEGAAWYERPSRRA